MGFHGLGVESELSHSDKDLAKDGGCLCVFLPRPPEVLYGHVTCVVHPNVGRNEVSHFWVEVLRAGGCDLLLFLCYDGCR